MARKKLVIIILILSIAGRLFPQIEHIEPPFWWAGMHNPSLQVMVHGENISGTDVSLEYPGVTLESMVRVENPNYLFLNLLLSTDVVPGSFGIKFMKGNRTVATYDYQLLQREKGSASREGFNSSDVIYLIMPDRFANGDPSNDEIEGMKEGLNRDSRWGRHGGDIKGITEHLDYISGMGFTAVWLNPVLENDMSRTSYHGYATTDFYSVDRRFGSNEDYRNLSVELKERGMKLVMDMIFNHCGLDHWWMDDLPMTDWLSVNEYVRTSHRRTVNQDPHASEVDKKEMVDGWFVPMMPDLNQRNAFMEEYLIQNSIWWIEYLGLSGIRMDTYPYTEKHMMSEWNRRVQEEYPDFNITGEEWSMNPIIVSYWQKGQTNTDGYDGRIPSMLDFPLNNAVIKALTEKEDFNSGWITLYEMLANDIIYPDPDNLVIFPDNHDMSRFYMQVGMNRDLFRLGMAFYLTTRGIPQIFYGTEILMTHTEGNDHGWIRKDFPGGWKGDSINGFTGEGLSKEEAGMQDWIRQLANWRKTAEVIHKGKLIHFAPEDGVYVYFRLDNQNCVMVVLNKNKKEITLDTSRFSEVIRERKIGTDVITGESFVLGKGLKLKPMWPLILEIQ